MLNARRPVSSFPSLSRGWRAVGLALCAACLATGALAQAALFTGPAGAVSSLDVQAEAATRISDQARATLLSRPANVEQLAANVYAQRMMAGLAKAKGLAASAEARVQLQLAQERALADLYWADFDTAHQPEDAALQSYARDAYRALDDKALQAPERTRVQHIFLKTATPDAAARMQAWLAQLKAGADFAQLAREHSEDQASAARGGDLGFAIESEMDPAFGQAVAALKSPGDLSPVVQTSAGYHIIRLEERRAAGKRPFDEVQDALIMQARNTLIKDAHAKEVQRLLEGAQPNGAAIDAFAQGYKAKAKD